MPDPLERYNVIWNSPSRDASGSMPLGNGGLAANVWVEEATGDLLLLIGKTDAWDENGSNLKLGRVRIGFSPRPARDPFRQALDLLRGQITIECGTIRVRVWVDANQPVIHIEADGLSAFEIDASLEMWRTEPRAIKTQTSDLFKQLGKPDPYPTVVSPDRLLPEQDRIVWCHHNEPREHDGYEINMRLQGLGGLLDQMPHPLLGRTFGAAMEGEGFRCAGERALKSIGPAASHRLSIYALTALHPLTVEQWRAQLHTTMAAIAAGDRSAARCDHERWWEAFWDRSHLFVHSADAFHVTQGYVLQRFMNACGGRGAQPIKFNGSVFTVGKPDDPDFRRWGGPGFWFQNMRLIYWPMLACGDFDLMRPWLDMYRDMLPLMKHRTQLYYGHAGAHYPETISFWGAEVSAHYGWTPFEQRQRPEAECPYVTYYWTGGIELSLILFNYWLYMGDDAFARDHLLPIANAVTEFFDLHYPRDEHGRIRIAPGQSLETWHEAVNATPDVSGLRYLLERLLELPPHIPHAALRTRWSWMLSELPPVPTGEKDAKPMILPGEFVARKTNKENPELYAVFPFRIFGLGKPDLQRARNTFSARLHASHDCWSQDDIHAAFLGLSDVAKEFVTRRAAPASHSDSRFPGFWNAFHDWVPDMDHGGVLQLALQCMLMQCEGSRIILLPAWPTDWDAEFKLHAPLRTTVEGKVVSGKIVDLRIAPAERAKDVIVWNEEK
ncbi:MAG TPA: DUF5703 domain-containing protein [Tepidisphaeraceae bacterium]|nr:DUF5703 domain-containing protein [Tepidisphaeraceae bacterium]